MMSVIFVALAAALVIAFISINQLQQKVVKNRQLLKESHEFQKELIRKNQELIEGLEKEMNLYGREGSE